MRGIKILQCYIHIEKTILSNSAEQSYGYYEDYVHVYGELCLIGIDQKT